MPYSCRPFSPMPYTWGRIHVSLIVFACYSFNKDFFPKINQALHTHTQQKKSTSRRFPGRIGTASTVTSVFKILKCERTTSHANIKFVEIISRMQIPDKSTTTLTKKKITIHTYSTLLSILLLKGTGNISLL